LAADGATAAAAAADERARFDGALCARREATDAASARLELEAARAESARLARSLAEQVALVDAMRDGATAEARLGDSRRERLAEAAAAQEKRAERACAALHALLVRAGLRQTTWEKSLAAAAGEEGAELRECAWVDAAQAALIEWVEETRREKERAQGAYEELRSHTGELSERLLARSGADRSRADRADERSRRLVGALHGAVRDAVDASEPPAALAAKAQRLRDGVAVAAGGHAKTELWLDQARASRAHSERLVGAVSKYATRNHLLLPRVPASIVMGTRGV